MQPMLKFAWLVKEDDDERLGAFSLDIYTHLAWMCCFSDDGDEPSDDRRSFDTTATTTRFRR